MAFWGIEVKPGKPFSHHYEESRGRLHISQATLGEGKSEKKSVVQCNVGDKSPVLLCCLMPNKTETSLLDLEFEEIEEVTLSVLGPRSVHLSGYYIGNDGHGHGHDDDSESYGEDIADSETEGSSDYLEDEEEYEDDFIDDNDEDDMEMYPPLHRRKSGVVIEEISEDEKPANGNGNRKRLQKKHQSDSDDGNEGKIIVKGSSGMWDSESEDEDGLPKSPSKEKAADEKVSVEDKNDKKTLKGRNKAEDGDGKVNASKRKIENVVQDDETERRVEELKEAKPEDAGKPKKKKKKPSKEGKTRGVREENVLPEEDKPQVKEAMADIQLVEAEEKVPNNKSSDVDAKSVTGEDQTDLKKKNKKKKQKKTPETPCVANGDDEVEVKPSQGKSYNNGLVYEYLQYGKPNGKKASPGSKVSVHYIGKLQKNGKIFDSNIGKAPFKFRLGIGEVIKGWDVGLNGMRIGDKRRITVPPAFGYGAQGAGGGKIPPNAWLVFDVELVDVR